MLIPNICLPSESLKAAKTLTKTSANSIYGDVRNRVKMAAFMALSAGSMYVIRNMGLLSEGKSAFINDESCSDFESASFAAVDGVILSGISWGANLVFQSVSNILHTIKEVR